MGRGRFVLRVSLRCLVLLFVAAVSCKKATQYESRAAPPQIPEFPWPPPHPSARHLIPRNLVVSHVPATLAGVAARLENALDSNGYTEKSYYAVPHGFALVTRLELFNEDGTSTQPPDRWSAEIPRRPYFSLSTVIDALFSANPGRYRVIVFIVSSHPFTASADTVTKDAAEVWLDGGMNVLPQEIGRRAYSMDFHTTALIYEFRQLNRDQAAQLRAPSSLTGKTHLEKAGILHSLEI